MYYLWEADSTYSDSTGSWTWKTYYVADPEGFTIETFTDKDKAQALVKKLNS